jgi:predicted Zn-dependent protease
MALPVRVLTCSLALLLASCQGQREMVRSHSVLMSTVEEEERGEEAAEAVERKLGFLEDEALAEYVEDIGELLARQSPRREVDYRFHVVEMEEPNAFALPGGYIYVSRGLVTLANSEEELANVLAHEVAHVALQHHAYRELEMRKAKWLGALAVLVGAVVGGAQGAAAAATGWMVAGQGVLAAYTREQEREADWLGQELARKAGWDPLAMASFLRTLDRHTRLRSGYSRQPGYFDTHPGSIERVAKATVRYEHAAALPDDTRGREVYLDRIEGLVVGQDPAHGVFAGSRFLHPELDFSLRFPDGWHTVNEASAVRAVSPRRGAMVILELQGSGDDPEAAAREYAEKAEVSLDFVEARRIHGNPAWRGHTGLDLEGQKVKADITWIAHEGRIYRITGVVEARRLASSATFGRVARSFRGLTPSERDGMQVTRLRTAVVGPEEDLEAFSRRTRNAWSRDETAVMNGLAIGEAFPAGARLKVAVSEPWVPE